MPGAWLAWSEGALVTSQRSGVVTRAAVPETARTYDWISRLRRDFVFLYCRPRTILTVATACTVAIERPRILWRATALSRGSIFQTEPFWSQDRFILAGTRLLFLDELRHPPLRCCRRSFSINRGRVPHIWKEVFYETTLKEGPLWARLASAGPLPERAKQRCLRPGIFRSYGSGVPRSYRAPWAFVENARKCPWGASELR